MTLRITTDNTFYLDIAPPDLCLCAEATAREHSKDDHNGPERESSLLSFCHRDSARPAFLDWKASAFYSETSHELCEKSITAGLATTQLPAFASRGKRVVQDRDNLM